MIFEELIKQYIRGALVIPYTNTRSIHLSRPICANSVVSTGSRKFVGEPGEASYHEICTNKAFIDIVDLYLESINRELSGDWAAELAFHLIDFF